MSRLKKIHYGWFIVFSGMMMLACSAGMINNTFGIFLVPICNDIGCTRTEISLCQTMFAASGLVASLFSGWIYKRFKLKTTMRLGAIGAVLSCALYTRMSSLPMMVALAFVMGLCSALMAWVPVSILISNWFQERRSFAMGITVTGSGIGGTLFSALGGIFLESLGWRGTLLLFSGIAAVITLPVTFFIIKPSPYDMGMRPYGEKTEEIAASEPILTGPGMKKALAMPKFYMLLLCIMLMGTGANALNGTLSSHMQDVGFSPSFGSFMFTIYMVVIIPGKIALGWAYDHLGLRTANTIGLCAMALTATLFILAKNQGLAILAAASAGIGLSIGSLMAPVLMRETFGTRDYSGLSGLGTAASNVGGILSLTLMGVVNDALGSYVPAYVVIVAMALLNAMTLLILTRKPVAE